MSDERKPVLNFTIAPDGVVIHQPVNERTMLHTLISEQEMNTLCQGWVQSRRELKKVITLSHQIAKEKLVA